MLNSFADFAYEFRISQIRSNSGQIPIILTFQPLIWPENEHT